MSRLAIALALSDALALIVPHETVFADASCAAFLEKESRNETMTLIRLYFEQASPSVHSKNSDFLILPVPPGVFLEYSKKEVIRRKRVINIVDYLHGASFCDSRD